MPGVCCTVAVCKNSLQKTKLDPNLKHIKYHAFPADQEVRKLWVAKCRRKGKWNPSSCHVCSAHFTEDDYVRDLKSELLNIPRKFILKHGVVPSQMLAEEGDDEKSEESSKTAKAKSRAERQEKKRSRELVQQILAAYDQKQEELQVKPKAPVVSEKARLVETELKLKAANDQLKRNADEIKVLRSTLQFTEQKVQRLKLQMRTLRTGLRTTRRSAQKMPSQKECENKVKMVLLGLFTETQVELLLKKKDRVNWTDNELSNAYKLRYLHMGRKAYNHLRKVLHYPLPGVTTLQNYANRT